MKPKLRGIIFLFLCIYLLAACGGGSDEDNIGGGGDSNVAEYTVIGCPPDLPPKGRFAPSVSSLLAKDERGLLTAPFDEIVIHATVRDAT